MEHNKESLENLRIHELRDLARKLGVQAPTSLKKETIIEQVMAIVNGDKKPYVKKSNKGRPARIGIDLTDMFIPSLNQDQGDKNDLVAENQKFGFFVNAPEITFNISSEASEKEGLLDIHPTGYGILRAKGYQPSDEDVFVSTQTVSENKLRPGLKIKGLEREIQKGKPHAIVRLLEIEGIDKDRYTHQTAFNEIPYSPLNDEIVIDIPSLSELKITEGSRNLAIFDNSDDLSILGLVLCKEISRNPKYKVVYLNLDAMPEDVLKFTDFEKVNIPFSMSEVNQISTINLALERGKRKVENGEDVVIVIKEMSKLLRILNTAITDVISYEDLNIKALHRIKKMIMSAKEAKYGSLTIIMLDNISTCPKPIKDIINFELIPLFNNLITINKPAR